ncbi:hypothetical protein PoB_006721300, partial [Plakobranchus ocellatus]
MAGELILEWKLKTELKRKSSGLLSFSQHLCRNKRGIDRRPWFYSLSTTSDLRLSGPSSCQCACDGARAHDRRVPADLRTDSLSTVPPTSLYNETVFR